MCVPESGPPMTFRTARDWYMDLPREHRCLLSLCGWYTLAATPVECYYDWHFRRISQYEFFYRYNRCLREPGLEFLHFETGVEYLQLLHDPNSLRVRRRAGKRRASALHAAPDSGGPPES